MLKIFAQFMVGFVGVILLLNAVTWLFGQAVAAIVAWFVALVALAVIIVGLTVGGYEAPPLTAKQAQDLKDYWQKA